MSGVPQQRRLEQILSMLRTGGLVAAVADVTQRPPSDPIGPSAMVIVLALGVGTVSIAMLNQRISSPLSVARLGIVAFVFDSVIICAAAWIWGTETVLPGTLLLLLPIEAALRFRLIGSLVGALLAGAFFGLIIANPVRDPAPFELGNFLFFSGLAFAIAVVVGWVAQGWHERTQVIEQQSARLFEMDQLKDRYIAMTSHEIRGPLTAMITAVDTVRTRWEELPPDRRDHLLEMVYLQGHQLDRLVEDLRISAEVQAGGVIVSPQWIDVEPTIKRALDGAADKRRAHLLEVFVEPLRAELDPYRLAQIVRNLTENAYKYTPDRTRVAVTAKSVDGGILVEVTDDGHGIPPAKRDQLFEAFSRIEETAAGQEGVGLGLYVVSQLVAAMDGRIDLSSSSRGTTFSINLPCRWTPVQGPRLGLVKEDTPRASG